jgi:hypothetical protein
LRLWLLSRHLGRRRIESRQAACVRPRLPLQKD